jgi:hypothetical protein
VPWRHRDRSKLRSLWRAKLKRASSKRSCGRALIVPPYISNECSLVPHSVSQSACVIIILTLHRIWGPSNVLFDKLSGFQSEFVKNFI